MKKGLKKLMAVALATTVLFGNLQTALACTGIYIGKDVSVDGTIMIGRSEDIGSGYTKKFLIHEGKTYNNGEMFTDAYGFSMPYPKVTYTYSACEDSLEYDEGERPYGEVGMNENGVGITATVSASAHAEAKEVDPLVDTGICEISMTEVVLMQAETAKDGIEKLAKIIDEYGAGEGNIIMVADANEAWYMEILTGHQYAAMKLPDDKMAVFPNTFMMGAIDVNSEDVIVSKNLVSLAEENGFLVKEDGMIHVAKTYGQMLSSEGNLYRAWGGYNKITGQLTPLTDDLEIDLLQTPHKKMSVYDVKEILAYRYEDTNMNANAEGNESVRAIGTPNQAECHVLTFDSDAPAAVAGVEWLAMGTSEFGIYLPFYSAIMTDTPDAFQEDSKYYSDDSVYWAFRAVGALAALDREQYGEGIANYYYAYQKGLMEAQEAIAPQMEALYKADPVAAAEKANALAEAVTEETLAIVKSIYNELMQYVAASEGKTQKEPFIPSVALDNVMPTYSFDAK
ncbi:MAG: C69 family dipeptidase [Bacillota bacterium]